MLRVRSGPLAFALGAWLAASCDEKGITSQCPALPLYQTYPLGDASVPDAALADSPATRAAFAAALDAGCATAPSDFAGEAGAAGEGGGLSVAGSDGSVETDAGAAGGP